MTTTKTTAPTANTALAKIPAATAPDIASLGVTLRAYAKADSASDKARDRFESAKDTREKMVAAFADTCLAIGWRDLTPIKKGGDAFSEFREMVAACILGKPDLAAFHSDQASYVTDKTGKRKYTAKHNAGNKVRNFTTRLIESAEPYLTGEKKAEGKGANANKAKDLATYMTDAMTAAIKRVGTDARKEAPTGKNHAKVKAVLESAAKELAQLLK